MTDAVTLPKHHKPPENEKSPSSRTTRSKQTNTTDSKLKTSTDEAASVRCAKRCIATNLHKNCKRGVRGIFRNSEGFGKGGFRNSEFRKGGSKIRKRKNCSRFPDSLELVSLYSVVKMVCSHTLLIRIPCRLVFAMLDEKGDRITVAVFGVISWLQKSPTDTSPFVWNCDLSIPCSSLSFDLLRKFLVSEFIRPRLISMDNKESWAFDIISIHRSKKTSKAIDTDASLAPVVTKLKSQFAASAETDGHNTELRGLRVFIFCSSVTSCCAVSLRRDKKRHSTTVFTASNCCFLSFKAFTPTCLTWRACSA